MFLANRKSTIAGMFALLLSLPACGCAQKVNQYELDNLSIGPDSPIQIPAGSSYTARLMYPIPDAPSQVSKARAHWSLVPPTPGISIGEQSGQITVAATVPHGTTVQIHADVDGRRQPLKAKMYVYTRAANPFIGVWKREALVSCSDTGEIPPDAALHDAIKAQQLTFYADGRFWIGTVRPITIAGGSITMMYGSYQYDSSHSALQLHPEWPRGTPVYNTTTALADETRKLTLKPLRFGQEAESVCGYVFGFQNPAHQTLPQ